MTEHHIPLQVTTVDYHTGGEPFRIVTGGVRAIPGATILEKRRWVAANLDHVRRLLVNEPRGHADRYGCFVVEPDDDGAADPTAQAPATVAAACALTVGPAWDDPRATARHLLGIVAHREEGPA